MQIKVTAAALVAAAVIAPAVAYSSYPADSVVAREIDEQNDFFGRDFEIEERDYDDNELLERDPLFGFRHIKQWIQNRKAKKLAALQNQNQNTDDSAPVDAREYEDEELVLREFDEMFERDLAELMERDPFLGWNHLKKWFGGKHHQDQNQNQNTDSGDASLAGREFEEDLEAREFDDEEFEAREYDDELEGRDYEEILERYFEDLNERELASEAEFAERYFDDDELMVREYDDDELFERNIIDWFKNLFHPKKKAAAKASATSTTTSAPAATSTAAATDAATTTDAAAAATSDAPAADAGATREYDDELMERDFDYDLFERDFDDDELYERNIIDWFKNLFHKKKPATTAAPAATSAPATSSAPAASATPAADASGSDAAQRREFEDSIDELD